MDYTISDWNQWVMGVRGKMEALRDAAKKQGIPHTAFYQEIQHHMAPLGVYASPSWLREQCDPHRQAVPDPEKFEALAAAVEAYEQATGTEPAKAAKQTHTPKPRTADHEPDDAETAFTEEELTALGKLLLEKPSHALVKIARLLNHTLTRHTSKGGHLTPLITYIRARVEFTHGVTLSNMPIHTLREIRTLDQAKAHNPTLKTTAALANILISINNPRANFPWGDDETVSQSAKDIITETIRASRTTKPKARTLAKQNKELIEKVVGTSVRGRILHKGA